MARVLLVLLWISVTVYAVADWARTPEENTPGRIPRVAWLFIILITAPTFSIGALAWIVVRRVQLAEARQRGEEVDGGSEPLLGGIARSIGKTFTGTDADSASPVAPDDDPEFLFKLQREIQRQRSQGASGRRDQNPESPTETTPESPADETDEAENPDQAQD
ncbi:phospholipase [Schaalia sp. 19OD2882]|uniref:phospholipase n=1 Tax=Schaalia sp. 19OD2882 TaxID=2794089 RepID=UPI001C1F0887|nr:phospholipase [Schaalia sp. 19OD2882]QWW19301.1 phospholipase [Schaalia sp. 19OD2882]